MFSFAIASVLLGIYAWLVYHGFQVAECISQGTACTKYTADDFTEPMASTLALIGGLVAALVVAELSITKPGEAPAARLIAPETAEKNKRLMEALTGLYLLVWLVTGLCAFFFGYLKADPNMPAAISNLGQSWLGIAVGAGYSYFGIKHPDAR